MANNDIKKIKIDPARVRKAATREDSFSGGWSKSESVSTTDNPIESQPTTPKATRADDIRKRAAELERLMRGGTSANAESPTHADDEKTPSAELSQREKSQSRRSEPAISIQSPTDVAEEHTPSAELSENRQHSKSVSSNEPATPPPFLSEIKRNAPASNAQRATLPDTKTPITAPAPATMKPQGNEKKSRAITSSKELDEKYNPPKPDYIPSKRLYSGGLPPLTSPPSAFKQEGPLQDPAAPPFLSAWDAARKKNQAQAAAKTASFDTTSLLSTIKNQNEAHENPLHVMQVDSRKKVQNYLNNYSKGLSRLMSDKDDLAVVKPEILVIDLSKILAECTTPGARIVAIGQVGDILQKIPKIAELHLVVDNLATHEVQQLAAKLNARKYPAIQQLHIHGDIAPAKLDELNKALQPHTAEAKASASLSHRQQPGLFNKPQSAAVQPGVEQTQTHKRKPS